jgi:hypothetical protein
LIHRFGGWLMWADERWRVHWPVALFTVFFIVFVTENGRNIV